ncbi:RNA methyltransferase [Allopusillimonas soli]|uniref:RNA methyltransferase n=1 Tax=Allopusillimonas soli TaxID=659016 RepID=A0A853FD18_9BURK|nr:RNA methyltransferase [Allopusillimonas soli]NYT38695.1 RNA methyltransferase [Allopusillimonas soli]TEA71602.1 RNA methyltransferase [Allopusillimonas soli]
MTQTFSSGESPLFDRVRFIMVQPSHPGNVGAAARAIKTMGFGDLCLVAPRFDDVLIQPEAQSLASGATDVLAAVRIFPTLAEALAPVTLGFALTARPRDLGPPACDIRAAADLGCMHLRQTAGRVAVVLGTERSGLTNEDIALCQRICHIPANPLYSSLNVAQALQLAAWEMRYALAAAASLPLLPSTQGQADAGHDPASGEQVQALMTHWEQALVEVGFLDPDHPKKLAPRMRHMFGRNALTRDEVDMMRGLCTAMIKTARGTDKKRQR